MDGATWMRFFFAAVSSSVDQYVDAMTGRFSQLALGERRTRNQKKNGVVVM